MLLALGFVASSTNLSPANAAQSLGDFYNSTKIHDVYLTIDASSVSNLNRAPKDYTMAKVELRSSGGSSGTFSTGVRLKGSTSLEKLSGRPSFKLKFNWSNLKGQRFLGLKSMTLNAMTQDTSLIHEATTYRLFNSMGIAAPKTGYARVYVNGTLKGFYLNVETVDDIFLSKNFGDPTQHLYEAIAFKDLKRGHDNGDAKSGAYLVDEGWSTTPNKADLTKLIEVANMPTGATWWSRMATFTDRTKLIRQFAIENFVGHWDGYSGPIINNHFLRSNDKGKFTMIPWGVDQTFGENRQTPVKGDSYYFAMDAKEVGYPWVMQSHKKRAIPRGMLFQKCLDFKPCKLQYLKELKAVSAKATSSKLATFMLNLSGVISDYSSAEAAREQLRSINWMKKQQSNVAAVLKKNGVK